MEFPNKIIVDDSENFNVIVAELDTSRGYETPDEIFIPVYKIKEIYHSLEDAIREEF